MFETDAVIIGAGPVGIFQVFELGLLGYKAHVLDSLPQVGGQCTELYPDKPIYDIPGLPSVLAGDLITNLMQQIEPFGATFHTGETVTAVQKRGEADFAIETASGKQFRCKTVFIAGGVGSFEPRRISARGIGRFEGTNIFYKVDDKTRFAGKDLVVLGGGDSALDWALELQGIASSVTLVHRSRQFRAQPASIARMDALCADHEMLFIEGTVSGVAEEDGRWIGLRVADTSGITRTLQCDAALCFWGLSPKLGPIAKWGLQLNRTQIHVDTEKFQTSVPGIYAVGDINWYPGKKKLILSGFHEAALAAFAAAEYLQPGEKVHLQYTTTSPKMHQRLGVEDPYKDAIDEIGDLD